MNKEILGYTKKGVPIQACKPGMVYTACILSCSECRKVIRGMGGPSSGALCANCYNSANGIYEVTEQEPAEGWYWWLPACDREHAQNMRRWNLTQFGPGYLQGRVGLFMGPIGMPKDWKARVSQHQLEVGK